MNLDALPPFDRTALLLDMDGTLLDIAPTPDSVVVAPGLPESLRTLSFHLRGALAIVTGRPIETVDALLGDAVPAVAGEHGGVVRRAPNQTAERPDLPFPPDAWLREAERLEAAWPGSLLERKAHGFALHFRNAPEAEMPIHARLSALIAGSPEFWMPPALMLWEIRPVGADKARGVRVLMERAPFAQRLPLFIGDDVTDEDGMRAARALGGAGLRVAPAFGDPAGVRAWLSHAARTGAWPPLPGARS